MTKTFQLGFRYKVTYFCKSHKQTESELHYVADVEGFRRDFARWNENAGRNNIELWRFELLDSRKGQVLFAGPDGRWYENILDGKRVEIHLTAAAS